MTGTRRVYAPPAKVLAQIEDALRAAQPGEIDWIAFAGAGEPTLHSSLGQLMRSVKEISDLPIAVVTNGSTLHLDDVREELLVADAVLPSLDAGSDELHRRINRPLHTDSFEELVGSLASFRKAFHGWLWIEVMLVRDINDSEEALRELAAALQRIHPDEIHLGTPTEPPAEPWVEPPDAEGLMRAMVILGEAGELVSPARGEFDLSAHSEVGPTIVSLLGRHPMREDELIRTLARWAPEEIFRTLGEMAAAGRAAKVTRLGQPFWMATGNGETAPPPFPEELASRCCSTYRWAGPGDGSGQP
jgi:wyosine [tRNA(Phe)-imidazoG37] synthetase (radical SAM superfamily)